MRVIACPISGEYKDNNVIRIVASFVMVISSLIIYTIYKGYGNLSVWITLILLTDFIIRAFLNSKYSLLAFLSTQLHQSFKLKMKRVDAAPKMFAARVGVLFTVTTFITLLLNFSLLALIVITILWLCAFLEAVFDFCVGCFVYQFIPLPLAQVLASKIDFK